MSMKGMEAGAMRAEPAETHSLPAPEPGTADHGATQHAPTHSVVRRLDRVLDKAFEEIYICDGASLRLLEVNAGARRSLGYGDDALLRMTLPELYEGHDLALLQGLLERLRGGEMEHLAYRTRHRRADGRSYPVEVRLSFSRGSQAPGHDNRPVFVAVASDIGKRLAQEQQLHRLAYFDALTGLPNRVLLQDRLRQAMLATGRLGRQLAVLFLDVDGFKLINDRNGHDTGDAVLRALAQRLTASLRASDTVARLGGDEFVIVAPGQRHLEDARLLARKLLEALRQPLSLEGRALLVSASIGVTLYPTDEGDADSLVRHADTAMYAAKNAGRATYRVYGVDCLP